MHWLAAALLLLIFVLATPAFGKPQFGNLGSVLKKKDKPAQSQQQQQSEADKKKAEEDKKKEEDKKLLFADDASKSKQKKDTTAMGFSGLNPDGTVEKALLEASPSAEDEAAAAALTLIRVAPGDLQTFITEGNLKSKGGK
jgi:flagellar motor protein MotB